LKTVNTTCSVYNKIPGGTCLEYNKDKPVYGSTCLVYSKKSVTDPSNCLEWNWLPGTICTGYSLKDVTTCELVEDPTSESGFRQICTTTKVNDACIAWSIRQGNLQDLRDDAGRDTARRTKPWLHRRRLQDQDSLVDDLTSCAVWNTPSSTTPARPGRRRKSMT
jgi:hypothetical protein